MFKFKLRHAIKFGVAKAYFIGHAVGISNAVLGAYAIGEGGCSVVDGTTCLVPGVRWLYYTGGACQLASGVCLMSASFMMTIAPPAAFVVGGVGYSMQKVGNHIVDSANTANPMPCLTKIF